MRERKLRSSFTQSIEKLEAFICVRVYYALILVTHSLFYLPQKMNEKKKHFYDHRKEMGFRFNHHIISTDFDNTEKGMRVHVSAKNSPVIACSFATSSPCMYICICINNVSNTETFRNCSRWQLQFIVDYSFFFIIAHPFLSISFLKLMSHFFHC